MEVILDTNFIISCLKKRIDFIEELTNNGFTIVIPREVMQELKDIRVKSSTADRAAIDVALAIFSTRRVKKTKLGGKTVDEGLIAKGKLGIYIATLDKAVRRAIPNRIVISEASKKLVVERS